MKNMFKRSLAAVMAVASLAVGMTGISASAIYDTVSFKKDAGSPGNTGVTSKAWSYYTSLSTSTITVNNFTATNDNTFILASISVEGNLKAMGSIFPASGSISATDLKLGKFAYSKADTNEVSGTIRATVSISG